MKTKAPIIGISPSHDTKTDDIFLHPTYLRAIKAAGGLPLVLPLEADEEDIRALLLLCNGFLFSGGPDIHPFLFGEETHAHCGDMSPARDRMELALLTAAMEAKKPILGICRGAQIINVGLGGGIIQDIPSQTERDFPIAHRQPFGYASPSHHVSVSAGSLLARLAGCPDNVPCSLSVNSIHHQSVGRLAPGLTACAEAPDGIIEAVEMPGYPFLLGVQWHPEYLWRTDPAAAGIFKGFVEACG